MTTETRATSAVAYQSDLRPDMIPFEEDLGVLRGFTYAGTLASEIAAGTITPPKRWTSSTTCCRSARSRR